MSAPSPDAVLHLAALHTLAATGFASTSRAASVTLSSTLARYLRLVAVTCTERASLAGRNKVAAIDVIQALDELGVGGVAELHEWTVGLDQEVCLSTPGLAGLGEELKEGTVYEEEFARLKLVPDEEIQEEYEDEDEDEAMEEDDTIQRPGQTSIRIKSPDYSWLPPLPGGESIPEQTTQHYATEEHPTTAVAPALSIIDRYRRRIPFSQSELSSLRPFVDPPSFPTSTPIPPSPSSFSTLSTAYAATRGEPSVALRQTPLRQQASELLRRTIATPDEYTPDDTLVVHIPGPRSTPVVPSHSDSPSIHAHAVPLNPHPTGLLTRMVHTMHSPHLPPNLRDRLTSVRPPQPQIRDGRPILYGEAVRGPSDEALARARGKASEVDATDQGLVQATWPAPSRGMERWGKRLPTGKRVIQSGVGEERPRVAPGSKPVGIPGIVADAGAESATTPGAPGKIKLRLSATTPGGSAQTPNGLSPLPVSNELSVSPHPPAESIASPIPPSPATAPGGTGLKLKLGAPKRPSESTSPNPNTVNGTNGDATSPVPPNGINNNNPPARPILSLKLSSRSISPLKSVSPQIKTERIEEDVNMDEGHVNGHANANGNGDSIANGNDRPNGNGTDYSVGH